jgi:hypothetical protein
MGSSLPQSNGFLLLIDLSIKRSESLPRHGKMLNASMISQAGKSAVSTKGTDGQVDFPLAMPEIPASVLAIKARALLHFSRGHTRIP